MQVDSMRRLDSWAGIPTTLALTLFRRLKRLLRKKSYTKPERVVIIKLIEQGATVVAAPALYRAIELVGRENIYFAVFTQNRPILDLLDIIPQDNIIEIRQHNLFTLATDVVKALKTLRRERVDTAVDFEFFSRFSAILAFLSGARNRIGFHSFAGEAGYRGDLMTHRIAYNIRLHASQTYHMLVESMMMHPDQLPTMGFIPPIRLDSAVYTPDTDSVGEVRTMLNDRFGVDLADGRIILLNANAGDLLPIRRWDNACYIELARLLLDDDPDIYIALTGGPDEQQGTEHLAEQIASPRCVSVAGHTTLKQLFALYSLSEVMVTNDSGPAHYASTTSIDVITLFGPENPEFFGATSANSHTIWTGLACSPCVNAFNQRITYCTDNLCMQSIKVPVVFDKVKTVLAQRSSDNTPEPLLADAT